MKTWLETANYNEEVYGIYVDREERFFICPECDEPIYGCDWEDHNDWDTCPICEFNYTEEE